MTLAVYAVNSQYWTDMPEALPRARARVKAKTSTPKAAKKGDEEILYAEIIVNDDGSLTYDANSGVEVDLYADPKYKAIRDEVRLSSKRGTFATGVRVEPIAEKGRGKSGIAVTEDK